MSTDARCRTLGVGVGVDVGIDGVGGTIVGGTIVGGGGRGVVVVVVF